MNHFKLPLRRTAGVAAALALSVSLAACGSDDESADDSGSGDTTSETSESPMDEGSESMDDSTGAMTETFGPACSEIPTDGEGSLDGMVDDTVATAASNNPLLSTLVTAVSSIDGLADTLNGAEALTVFAPYNGAFEELGQKNVNALVKDAKKNGQDSDLYAVLAHHVVGENATADAVVGEHDTLAGDTVTVEGDPESGMTVSDGDVTANVLCGNIPTANATVYVIDQVMTGVK
ncbi:fasciclin domain-containing protein [Nocardioides sambongensis]|uniref:fasciclin domain-containing protein n=1 Tax=Nocardioides sambongensis TaxID=2589074 RepID=UPI001129A455|nr:fasciclin domain-containing protein [Nocardioides sambongensis]